MKAVIVSIGDEILTGLIPNNNAAFIAEKLTGIGINVERIITVGDNESEIIRCFHENFKQSALLIATGGLGPTHDDITRSAICKFFGVKLIQNNEVRKSVEHFLKERNRNWSEAAENQTYIPENATAILNRYGTAVGELFLKNEKILIVLPGVPYEMESMMIDFVIPYLIKLPGRKAILLRTFMTTGIPESELANKLKNILPKFSQIKFAYLPSPLGVRLRLIASDANSEKSEQQINEAEKLIRSVAEKYIYAVDDESLEEVIGRLLTEKNLKIAVAESCTGGLISHRLTNIPGSSLYFERAVIAYSNKTKTDILNVPEELIISHGAVSSEVAEAMAIGVKQLAGTDIGLSTTGIAGPRGGYDEKPVGLVWIGYADDKSVFSRKYLFGEGRIRVKERASQAALDLIRRKILNIE